MPIRTEGSVVIQCPIYEVFEYTNHNVADWSTTVVESELLESAEHQGVGTRFRCVTVSQGNRMEFDGTVMKWDPPTMSAIELIGRQFDIRAVYTFEDLGRETRVTQASAVHPKGLLGKLIFLVMRPIIRRSGCDGVQKELESLKQKLEQRSFADATHE